MSKKDADGTSVRRMPFRNWMSYKRRLRGAADGWSFLTYLGLALHALWRRHVLGKNPRLNDVLEAITQFECEDVELQSNIWRLYDCLLVKNLPWGCVLSRGVELLQSGLTRQWRVTRLSLEVV